MLIDGAYNNTSIKTPTKIHTRKPKVNNNVIDINTPSSSHIMVPSAPLPTNIEEDVKQDVKQDIKKPKYRTKCINAIMSGQIKLSDISTTCNIEKKDKFKNILKEFIYGLGEIQTDKIKKYIATIFNENLSTDLEKD